MLTIYDFVTLFIEYDYMTVEIFSTDDCITVWSGCGKDIIGIIGEYSVDSVDSPKENHIVINSSDATKEAIENDFENDLIDAENIPFISYCKKVTFPCDTCDKAKCAGCI